MNKCLETINLVNHSIESILQVVNNFIIDTKNEKLKKLETKIIGEYEIIIDECKIIAKSYKKDVENLGFFEKYQNLITLKILNINKKDTFFIAKNIYLAICQVMPILYHSLIEDCDENTLVKKLIDLNEEYLTHLKSFFVINEV